LIKLYDDKLVEYLHAGNIKKSILIGEKLLKFYDKINMSSIMYSRTCYDLFQVVISTRETLPKYENYLKLAIKHRTDYLHPFDKNDKVVIGYQALLDDPTTHLGYLSGENPMVKMIRALSKANIQ
jgi:hypothetical protein